MKSIFFALLAVVFAGALCFAQDVGESTASSSQAESAAAQSEARTLSGKIKSLSAGNADEGASPQITVTDDSGQAMTFVVESATTITNDAENTLSFGDLKSDSQVTVKYTVGADGVNKAQTITIAQQQS